MRPGAWILAGAAAALAGCATEAVSPLGRPIEGELSVDIRGRAQVRIECTAAGSASAGQAGCAAGGDTRVTITLSSGHGVAPDGGALTGSGRVEPFPEAGSTLITGRLDAPPSAGGPCGAAPVSLALSLHRRGDAARVGGALTAYCGRGVWTGVPARVLRLTGDLPL